MNNNITSSLWNNITQWANLGSTPNISTTTQINTQSSENRESMIRRLYKLILGREADQDGLNYFLRNNLTEQEIAKEMYESTEHVDILNKAKDVRNVLLKYEEALKKIESLEKKLKDTEILLAKYKELLQQPIQSNHPQQGENNNDNTLNANLNSNNQNNQQNEQTPEVIIIEDPFENDKKNNNLLNIFKDWFRFD